MSEPGSLWYVVGPSGAGKDSLLHWVANNGEALEVRIARRIVTRDSDASEDSDRMSPEEFAATVQSGGFALHWRAHGLRYGIRREIDTWLAAGSQVVVNGSREYIPQLLQCYPQARIVWIRVSKEILAERLTQRGRETAQQIEARLARSARLENISEVAPKQLFVIDNNANLQQAGRAFLALLARTK
jgi:ribose 1,5-bisphosphokinase